MFLETGIFLSHVVWLFRTRLLRKQANLAGQSFDDLPEAQAYQVKRPGNEEEVRIQTGDVEEGNTHSDVQLDHMSCPAQQATTSNRWTSTNVLGDESNGLGNSTVCKSD